MFDCFCNKKATTLVVGGTGKTGRRVCDRLTEMGHPYRVGSRSADIPFDWDDAEGWRATLEGMKSAYVVYYPDLAVPGAVEKLQLFIDLAKQGGLEHIVLLSGRGEEEAQRGERVVQESGLAWTIVRASWFNQNFSENFLLDPVRYGHVALPVGSVKEPFIDADDIADVVVAALTEEGHEGQLYEVTGPRLMAFDEVVSEMAKAAGHEVVLERVSIEEYEEMLKAHNIPAEFISLVLYLFTTVLDGRNAYVTEGVQQALGRGAKDFADYARETAATGVWDAPAAEVA